LENARADRMLAEVKAMHLAGEFIAWAVSDTDLTVPPNTSP
jgi:hypothetical protein